MIADVIFKIIIGTAIGLIFGLLKILFERVGERPKEWEVNRLIAREYTDKVATVAGDLCKRNDKMDRDIKWLKDGYFDILEAINKVKSNVDFENDKRDFLKNHAGEPLTEGLFDRIRGL